MSTKAKKQMNKKTIITTVAVVFVFLFFCSFVFFSGAAYAQTETGLKPPTLQINIPTLDTSQWTTGNAGNWVGVYIVAIYKYGVGIIGIVAAVVMMYGGILWLTAGGASDRVSEAKEWIKASLYGLIIALTSYTLLYVVNPDLVSFTSLDITKIQQIADTANSLTRAGTTMNLSGVTNGTTLTQAFEGLKLNPYQDSLDNWTIGYGHKLTSQNQLGQSITAAEANTLFMSDYAAARKAAGTVAQQKGIDFNNLSSERQVVLTDMAFNMGEAGLSKFNKMFEGIKNGNWETAAAEIKDSRYAGQVGARADTNAEIMRTSKLP
jgi:lysozyme